MKLLLDTHVLIWWLRDKSSLTARTRMVLADPRVRAWVSVASFWEIAIKQRLGKLDEIAPILWSEAVEQGFGVLAVAPAHLAELAALEPEADHKDPFDHLILAQTLAEGATLVTGDRRLLAYPVRSLRAK